VIRGVLGVSFLATGLGFLTGHFCIIMSSLPSARVQITASTLNFPFFISFTVPETLGGTSILCSIFCVSWTVPIISPPLTLSLFLTVGTKSHSFSRERPLAETPRFMKSPHAVPSIQEEGAEYRRKCSQEALVRVRLIRTFRIFYWFTGF